MSFNSRRKWWPLYLQILAGLLVGSAAGAILHPHWRGSATPALGPAVAGMNAAVEIVLRLLRAVASPLILVVVVKAVSEARITGRLARRMIFLLLLNATVAVSIAVLVANVLRPGGHARLESLSSAPAPAPRDVVSQLLGSIPSNILSPIVENNPIGVVLIALAVGIAARRLPPAQRPILRRATEIGQALAITMLHWILQLLPLAVACKIAAVLIASGFGPFAAVLWFVVAVVLALLLQTGYYLVRLAAGSRIRPMRLLRGTRDALLMAFSTASSLATMPVSYECLVERVGLEPRIAALGVFVGGNFNHDGAAIYEALSALFIAQAIGWKLSLAHQLLIILTSMAVSIGAAGIPEAGLVTMSLVFGAVGLPLQYVALLLPVDWFLDRCRTTVNVLGDLNVSCMLETNSSRSSAPSLAGDLNLQLEPAESLFLRK